MWAARPRGQSSQESSCYNTLFYVPLAANFPTGFERKDLALEAPIILPRIWSVSLGQGQDVAGYWWLLYNTHLLLSPCLSDLQFILEQALRASSSAPPHLDLPALACGDSNASSDSWVMERNLARAEKLCKPAVVNSSSKNIYIWK